ncbi:DUF6370 family protein [Mariniflexile sp.]|uniref:DUF6370 family protein n=1 Tax=Mariniflexile sp. TaxID=1979402 RepID=UPI003563E1AA
MKRGLVACFLILGLACVNPKTEPQIVEVSCGQCQFKMTSQKGCDLAVRMDGKAYFVDGAHIDDFGDAHNIDTGFCEVIRTAEVTGEVINDRFKISSVKLLNNE